MVALHAGVQGAFGCNQEGLECGSVRWLIKRVEKMNVGLQVELPNDRGEELAVYE